MLKNVDLVAHVALLLTAIGAAAYSRYARRAPWWVATLYLMVAGCAIVLIVYKVLA
jgi:hypothetical protein